MMSDTTERPNEPDRKALAAIPGRWAQPEPATLATLPKGGAQLSYMGHAEVTLALIEDDPAWNWRPMSLDVDSGGPAIEVHPKRLVMWGYLTVHGVDRLCVGTCEPGKGDPEKELVGDLLRNGAMRFGIGTKLWSKATDADPAGTGQAGFRRNRKAEPATPEPAYEQPTAPSAGSVALYARVHATKGTPMADVLRGFAADEAKSLTARTFDADPTFADQVAAILDTAPTG